MKDGRRIVIGGFVVALAAAGRAFLPAASAGPASPTVATVGPRAITAAELDARSKLTVQEYRQRSGSEISGQLSRLLRRHALESLIRANLLILESERQNIPVSDAEAEERLKQDPLFQDRGAFSPARFAAAKRNTPEVYREAIGRIKQEIAVRRLEERARRDAALDDARIRSEVERELSRARVSVLALRVRNLGGEYPEPSEAEVVAYYRTHADEFHRSARAVLSVIEIPAPAGSALSAARLRADSAIAALRRGVPIQSVATLHGLLRPDVVVLPGNFPGFWQGSDEDSRQVFGHPPGTVLDHPVRGLDAVLVVRIESSTPDRVAALSEVASDIRARLKAANGREKRDRDLRALYETRRDGLVAPAARVRYAVIDTSRIRTSEPRPDDLDRFYRSHLADYTSYDAAASAIRVQPFDEVRDQVRRRWKQDAAMAAARTLAADLEAAWGSNRRDGRAEARAQIREAGPMPVGAPLGTDPAAVAMSAVLANRGLVPGAGSAPYGGGLIVYQVHDVNSTHSLTFDEARPALEAELRAQRDAQELEGARALFERDPARFAAGDMMYFSRMPIGRPELVETPLTREEVERYHLEHLGQYSAPERMQARHILVSPQDASPGADAAARAKAEGLLRRLRAGEDFATLAAEHSDDPPTRPKGGDLGFFERGMMLARFEDAAFRLRPGQISDPVRTEAGYHIIRCDAYEPMISEPLVYLYQVVAMDAAKEKGDRMARALADSVFRTLRTPAQAHAAARKLGVPVIPLKHPIGKASTYPERTREMMMRLEGMKAGQMYPGVEFLFGTGALIQWVDSIVPVRAPSFEEVKDEVLSAYRLEANANLFEAKQAEVDSLMDAWGSFDSVAALWGGIQEVEIKPGKGLPGIGDPAVVDSLVFGGAAAPSLAPGQVSGWFRVRDGVARLRVDERTRPSAGEVAAQMESRRRRATQGRLHDYFEDLKRRFPVRIFDSDLRGILLPRPGEEPGSS